MKENRKLLREVLKDIRHDMTDEEVLNLLADSKISGSSRKRKGKVYIRTACRRYHCKICRQLGVHLFLYRRACSLDGRQCHSGSQSL